MAPSTGETGCHAPGKPYPVIAGQRPGYITQRLRLWCGEEEVVDARKSYAVMPFIARLIPEEMIEPLAAYLGRHRALGGFRSGSGAPICRR